MREFIQKKLEELPDIESGNIVQEDIIELGKTYFGYTISVNEQKCDQDKNFTNRVSLIGFIIRRNNPTENTLEIVDKATIKIINKLKEINIKASSEDVTNNDNSKKIKITGYCYFNEINNKIVL